jgi:hypothetical protein
LRLLKHVGNLADRHNESPQGQKDKTHHTTNQEVFCFHLFGNKKSDLQGL